MLPIKFQVLAFRLWKRNEKIFFQDGHHGSHLGFPIAKILAVFDLQVLPSFKSIGLSVQEKKQKIDFQDTYVIFAIIV